MNRSALPTVIDVSASAVTRQERWVDAPPERVFDLLADPAAWPHWQPAVSEVSVAGPLAVGAVFRWRSGVRITSTVSNLERGRAIAWTGCAIGTRAIHTWLLEPVDGGTLVVTEESMSGWLPTLMTSWVQRTLDRGVQDVLGALEATLG
jgi:uncharacterized protein YndB with AHSA1/START domain